MAEPFRKMFYKLNQSRDPAALGIARFAFGFLMILDIFDERGLTRLPVKHGDPDSCSFPLFQNLPIFSIEYLYMVYFVLLLAATGIMLGFLYKLSCMAFVVCYWYLFFLDKTVWNNHSYLYGLISIQLLLCNANYYWSVDGLLWPSIRNKKVPLWQYGIIRFQVFLLYFYAGLKKLDRDWITGYSMVGLSRKWIFAPFRTLLSSKQIDFYLVHGGGLIFDLTQGFLLSFDKTRKIGFFFGYNFHGMNAVIFSIGMFSYMCMALIPIFCWTDWPKNAVATLSPSFLRPILPTVENAQENTDCSDCMIDNKADGHQKQKKKGSTTRKSHSSSWKWTWKTVFLNSICLIYVIIQLVLPFSHSVTKGYNSWVKGLYGYSWDMMIHSHSTQHVVVKARDAVTGEEQYLRPGAFFPYGSIKNRVFSHPDMMKQYAVCLAERIKDMEEININEPEIYFDVWRSMNQRYQQRVLDPRVNLVTAAWSPFEEATWLKPLLVELSSWRENLRAIRDVNYAKDNATEVVFVADFPGLYLENYIAPEIEANVTVMHGEIVVESEHKSNTSVKVNETLTLGSDETHIIYTVSGSPSCYMYVYYNTSWVQKSLDELVSEDAELQEKMEKATKWDNMTLYEKFSKFMRGKLLNMKRGVLQIYMAFEVILELNTDAGDENISDVRDDL